jgi:hypothetical protein
MGSQLVANTVSGNYVVCNNTFAPNISGGFSISLWFSCSGQLNKTGTLISLPLNKTQNGVQIDISGTNMLYSVWNLGEPIDLINSYTSIWLDSASSYVIRSGSNVTTWNDRSTNGFNLTPVSNPNAITYNSTSPTSVRITSGGTYLTGSYFYQNTATKFNMLTSRQTWFFVISGLSTGCDSRLVGLHSNDNTCGFDILIQSNRFFVYNHGADGGVGFGIDYFFSDTSRKYLISISLDISSPSHANSLTNSIIRVNGTTQTGNTVNTGRSSFNLSGSSYSLLIGALAINNNYYTSPNAFNIHEIIGINNQSFNLTNIRTVETYLNAKWNLGNTIT